MPLSAAPPACEKWGTEELLSHLICALPVPAETLPISRDLLVLQLSDSVREDEFDGKALLQMMCDVATPGGPRLEAHPVFQRVFSKLGPEFRDLLRCSPTAMRGIEDIVQFWLSQLVLEHSGVAIQGAMTRIFSVIGEHSRARGFDCYYSLEDDWCIECGPGMPFPNAAAPEAVLGSYVCPLGWLRVALRVRDGPSGAKDWQRWHKCYHGTAGGNVDRIVASGLLAPGTGRVRSLHGKAGAAEGRAAIYTSPSVEYAAHWLYTKENLAWVDGDLAATLSSGAACNACDAAAGPPNGGACEGIQDWTSAATQAEDGAYAQYVFECRVRPGSYRVQGNTLYPEDMPGCLWPDPQLLYDIRCPTSCLEWLTEDPADIVCTGVLIRQLSVHPKAYTDARVQEMKRHVGWSDSERQPTRPRDHDGVDSTQVPVDEVVWEFNMASDRTLLYDDLQPWAPYPPAVSRVIELAYRSYQRFAFLGRLQGAPGPYLIDFQGWCLPELETEPNTARPEQRRADFDKQQAWRRRAVRRKLLSQHTVKSLC